LQFKTVHLGRTIGWHGVDQLRAAG